jgi:hypothetical protein
LRPQQPVVVVVVFAPVVVVVVVVVVLLKRYDSVKLKEDFFVRLQICVSKATFFMPEIIGN